MEKIDFQDGQLVKAGYVNIEGTQYPIVEAEYEGTTPLSAFVLNKLQANIESEINKIQEEISKQTQSSYSVKIAQAITQNTNYELPGTYIVNSQNMELYMEGVLLIKNEDYIEVGTEGETSNTIKFNWNIKTGYVLIQKVRGESTKIYSADEAVEAVKQLWIEQHDSLDGVYIQTSGTDESKNHIVVVRSSTDTSALAWYTVDRLNLSIEETR